MTGPETGPDRGLRKMGPRDLGVSRFAFRLWNGMTLGAFLRLMKGNWSKVAPARYPALAGIIVTASFNQLRKWIAAGLIEPKLRNTLISPAPVFILGHWRSGTTWLHQTMLADPRLGAPTMEACFSPECFLVGRRLLAPLLRLIFPTSRPMDNVGVGMNAPEEDEHALLLSGAWSPYRGLLLASETVAGAKVHPENMPETEAAYWRKVWLAFLRRVQFANPGKRLVLKSPAHTARISEILRLFPDAQFIHIVRDPYRIFASVRKTNAVMQALQSLQTHIPSQAAIDASLLDRFTQLHEAFDAQAGLIPEGRLITIRYEDLKADIPGIMRAIYDRLDLGDFDAVAARYGEVAERSQSYKTNPFALEPEVIALIDARWDRYFHQYGYAKMADREETLT